MKPENILLDVDNNVKLADFGLSNIMKDGIFLYSSCGSPNYAAPELISGKYYNGAAIDIWSCGVILYTLLTGYLPFNEKQTNKLYKKITECKYILPENISDSAKDLIFRILQKNPLDRITIPEIKQHKWFSNKLSLFQVIDNAKYIYGSRAQVDKDIIHQIATNEKIGQKISAKILQKSIIKKQNLEEKVKREIRFSKYFRHPNIIHLYEVIETQNEIIMIMEYASGGELFDLICRGQVS